MRIFLDANILFSAAKSDGAIRYLVEQLHRDGHTCCADGFVAEEARRNLTIKAPLGLPYLDALLSQIPVASAQPTDIELQATLPLPDKDKPVLAAAIRQKCEALITGDRSDFGRHYGKRIHGVKIYSPRLVAQALFK